MFKTQRGRDGDRAECLSASLVVCIHLPVPNIPSPSFHLTTVSTAMNDSYSKYNKYTCFFQVLLFFLSVFFLLSAFVEVCSVAVTFQLQQVSLMTSMLLHMAAVVTTGGKYPLTCLEHA